MTEASTTPRWGRWSRRSVGVLLIALAFGAGIGLLVNVRSPNPAYGIQLIADFFAILVLLVVALVPALRRLLPAALGLAIGVIAGVAIGMNLVTVPSPYVDGTVNLQLGKPEIVNGSASAICLVVDGVLDFAETPRDGGLHLADGRSLWLSIGPHVLEPSAAAPLGIVVFIGGTLPDGSPTETRMASDSSSTITVTNAGATGSMAFSGLVLHPDSEQRELIDVAGTVSWDCAP
jgi:hypothetical protein